MQSRLFITAVFWFLSVSCFTPAGTNDGSGMTVPSFPSKNKKKRLITPPAIVRDAVLDYHRKYHQWPFSVEAACSDRYSHQVYQQFIEQGITDIRYMLQTRDTLLVQVEYSRTKNAAYKGDERTYVPDLIVGHYEFVADREFTFFRVRLGKVR